jgi:putative membrane protein
MPYLALKTAHILAVMLWLCCAAGDLWVLGNVQQPEVIRRWRHSGGRAGHVALGLVWILGLILMHLGHWSVFAWMKLKLALVVGLSALHGSASARLRRGQPHQSWRPPLLFLLIALVVALVVNKGSAAPRTEQAAHGHRLQTGTGSLLGPPGPEPAGR